MTTQGTVADADEKPQSPAKDPEGRAAAKRRDLMEWIVVVVVAGGILLILGVLTFQEGRAERYGFLAGIGWRPLQSALLTILIFALFTYGLNVQFGYTGLINFGHVASLAIGAYTAAILTWGKATLFGRPIGFPTTEVRPGVVESVVYGAPFWSAVGYAFITIVAACIVAVAFALLLGIPTLKLREDYLAIVTIGAAEILRIFLLNQEELTNGPTGLAVRVPGNAWVNDAVNGWAAPFKSLREGPWQINMDPYYAFMILLVIAALAVVYVLFEMLARSPWGRVVRAIREDEDVAASLGKNVFVYKMQALILGSMVAAVAGVMYAWFTRYVTPISFLPIITFYAWIILVVGGAGNNKGPIVGAFLMWGIFEVARNVPDLAVVGLADVSGPAQITLIGVLLVIVMMFRPQGLLGRKEEMLFDK